MKTTKKIIKIGDSQGIVIDKPLLNNLKLNTGDLVEINVKKIKVEN
jgi:antitoxin component of MazEF toxin-antitoxin module